MSNYEPAKPFTKPLERHDAEYIFSLPLLSEILPYKFDSTECTINFLSIKCSKCGSEILPGMIRANFEKWNKGNTISMQAFGMCSECSLITPCEARLHSDGSSLTKTNGIWKSGRWMKRADANELSWKGLLAGGWQDFLPPFLAGITVSIWILMHK